MIGWKLIIERLYNQGKVDEEKLNQYVADGKITEEEKEDILNKIEISS